MKTGKKAARIAAVALGTVIGVGTMGVFAGCGGGSDTLVVMSEALDGLFNPFYSTTGADMDVVGMTQVSMLSTDSEGKVAYGEQENTVVLDYESKPNPDEIGTNPDKQGVTTYYFVLKNGIKFSDGVNLTMNDVLFNMYVYLDPVYTGSSTMYSTDIVGLESYRTQRTVSGGSESSSITMDANNRAQDRINELINLYYDTGRTSTGSTTYDAGEEKMKNAINSFTAFSDGYKNAITNDKDISVADLQKQLLADYNFTLATFRKELESDYESAKDSYTDSPYKETGKFDEVTSFMYMEGFVTIEYEQQQGSTVDKSKIKKVTPDYNTSVVKDRESAIKYVYDSKVASALDVILSYWGTANTVKTDYISKATEVILHENLKEGDLSTPNVSGIVSMGHSTDQNEITINGKQYKIAHEHNEDGSVKNANEYDVLRIKVNGVDPKAIWNFGFSVAPYHYYSDPATYKMDIAQNKFGVEWGSYDFMKDVIQGRNKNGVLKNQLPLGAGPYVATDKNYSDNPSGGDFYSANVVWYKSNKDFFLGAPKIEKLCYQVVSSTNALDVLKSGSVHYVTPQFTKENKVLIDEAKSDGIDSVATWQLGYGYIGINAGKVEDLNLRKAIMSAMNISLALDFYEPGTVAPIAFPMSLVSWAYPRTGNNKLDPANPLLNAETNNGKDYMMFTDDESAKAKIKKYMGYAGVSENDSRLSVKFTIAGANMNEHPTYAVFKKAQTLLNECGWNIDVIPDTNALTKLSTGSLAVWAAAWGSTIDPDMYQVYHKNSTATSVIAWGYREILSGGNNRADENDILNRLAVKIEDARETDVRDERIPLYRDAMDLVMDLAVEMPVYQRQVLYAYNAKVIDKATLPATINSYTSPLSKIWEVDFVK